MFVVWCGYVAVLKFSFSLGNLDLLVYDAGEDVMLVDDVVL